MKRYFLKPAALLLVLSLAFTAAGCRKTGAGNPESSDPTASSFTETELQNTEERSDGEETSERSSQELTEASPSDSSASDSSEAAEKQTTQAAGTPGATVPSTKAAAPSTEASVPAGTTPSTTAAPPAATKSPTTTAESRTSAASETSGGSQSTPSGGNPPANAASLAQRVLQLVNEERAAAGLSPLTYCDALQGAADTRAREIVTLFDHTRSDGTSCFTAFTVSYRAAGENIAYGYRSAEAVMEGWMNSSGHRANILYESFTQLAVGVVEYNGVLYWVQLFIG